jgi:hypothetical protein
VGHSSLQDQAFETVKARLDTAEKNIHEALASEDSRRRDAASFFVLRNIARAKRRGWITSASASVDVNIQNNKTANYTFRWRNADDPDPGCGTRVRRWSRLGDQTRTRRSSRLRPSQRTSDHSAATATGALTRSMIRRSSSKSSQSEHEPQQTNTAWRSGD